MKYKKFENRNRNNKESILENCASFACCIDKRNNRQVVKTKNLDVVIPMCNLIKYNDHL